MVIINSKRIYENHDHELGDIIAKEVGNMIENAPISSGGFRLYNCAGPWAISDNWKIQLKERT